MHSLIIYIYVFLLFHSSCLQCLSTWKTRLDWGFSESTISQLYDQTLALNLQQQSRKGKIRIIYEKDFWTQRNGSRQSRMKRNKTTMGDQSMSNLVAHKLTTRTVCPQSCLPATNNAPNILVRNLYLSSRRWNKCIVHLEVVDWWHVIANQYILTA